MSTTARTPFPEELGAVLGVLATWQIADSPLQLHPGDIGWYQRFGLDRTAAAVRTWSRGGQPLAIGLLEGSDLLRLAIDPEAHQDEDLARDLVQDLGMRGSGAVLAQDAASLEVPTGVLLGELLEEAGWAPDEAWTPLHQDLTEPVPDPGVRVEFVGPDLAPTRIAVQRDAFDGSTFTLERWQAMASGPMYRRARCLVAFDETDTAVATTTVWSAGVGRIGLIEPLGVGREHRGKGYGTAITRAGTAILRELGASGVHVCTPRANTTAVAAYLSAGFTALPQRRDWRRAQ